MGCVASSISQQIQDRGPRATSILKRVQPQGVINFEQKPAGLSGISSIFASFEAVPKEDPKRGETNWCKNGESRDHTTGFPRTRPGSASLFPMGAEQQVYESRPAVRHGQLIQGR